MERNAKYVLGKNELYLINGTDIEPLMSNEEKLHHTWVKNMLTEKEINYIKELPLFYEINISYDGKIDDKKIVLCHYLIEDEKKNQPFAKTDLKNDIDLWIKYNDSNIIYVIGYFHKPFNVNEVPGISCDFIEEIGELLNIEIVSSSGCSENGNVSYLLIEIDRGFKFQVQKVQFDREKFIKKIIDNDFPNKNNILKSFYGIK